MGRISYFQMEISLGRWNTKLFLGRGSYLLSQKQGYTKGSKTIRNMFFHVFPSNTRCPDPPGIEPAGFFSRRPIWTFWPPKNSNWTSWEENLKPHPLNQKTRRRSERSGLFRQMKAIIQRFNQTYAAQTRRESSLRVFLKTSNLDFLAAKKLKLDVLRGKLEAPSS